MTGTLAVFERLVRQGIPQEQMEVLRVWETKQIGDVLVESMPADHPWQLKDLARGGRPYRMGDCCGFILNTAGWANLFSGRHTPNGGTPSNPPWIFWHLMYPPASIT